MSCSSLVDFVSLRAIQGSIGERERGALNLIKARQVRVHLRNPLRTIPADHSTPNLAPLRIRACGTGGHLSGAQPDRSSETPRYPSHPIGTVAIGHPNPSPSMVRSAEPISLRSCSSIPTNRPCDSLRFRSTASIMDPEERSGIHKFRIRAVSNSLTSTEGRWARV